MPRVLVALGANLGDRRSSLARAGQLLAAHPAIHGLAISGFHETAPIGGPPGQDPFLNAAASLETTLSPDALYALLSQIEAQLGRTSAKRWSARTIDLDLLLYGEGVIDAAELQVPHPRMAFRRFVLEPAVEVAADAVHPLIGWTIGELLAHLNHAAPYVAVCGADPLRVQEIAHLAATVTHGRLIRYPQATQMLATPADPPSQSAAAPIQFLDHAARLLAGVTPDSPPAVSDFYFDQVLAWARVDCGDEDFARVQAAWGAAAGRIVVPRLLVMLDSWHAAVAARSRPNPPQAARGERIRHELVRLALRPGIGPVVFAGERPDEQQAEVLAALAASR